MTGLLRDTSPLVAEVLDGTHDEILNDLRAAVEFRQKQKTMVVDGLRPKARVRIKNDPRAKDYAGREGVVDRVNKQTVTVSLVCPACGSATEKKSESFEDACSSCYGIPDGVRISPGLVEAIR